MTYPRRSGPSIPSLSGVSLALAIFLWPALNGFGQPALVLAQPELLPTGDLRIGVRGAPNDFIFLEYAPESVGPWSTLTSFHLNASGAGEYIDNTANPRRLYRARNDGQLYSVNIVGYANVAVPATGFAGNPFLTTNGNAVTTVLPNASNGMVLLKLGASGYQNNNFLNGWSNPTMPLLPGEGFFVKDLSGAATTVTLLGEVVNGNCNRLPAGFSLASSIVPRSGLLQSQLQFPAAEGDEILIFNRSSGAYDIYDFFFDSWIPSEPSLGVGQAFWCSKSIAADWSQTGGGGNCSFGPTALNSSVAQVNFFTYNGSAGSGQTQNLVLNGSFEAPSIPPNTSSPTPPASWTMTGSLAGLVNGDYSPGYPLPQSGQQYASVGGSSSLFQTFSNAAFGAFTLTWFDSTEFNGPNQQSPYSVSVIDTAANLVVSTNSYDANASSLRVWRLRSVTFVLAPGAYTLRFDGHAGPFAERSLIDNVSLVNSGLGRVFRSDGVTPLGTNYLAQLYASTDATEASLTPSGTPVRFLPGNVAGYVRGGTVNINGASPGQTVYLQVRVWDSALGTTYETAAGGSRGKSAIFSVMAGGNISYFPPEANNFPSFSLAEPPVITTQPASATVLAGGTAQFSVATSGSLPMGFRWRRGTVTIATNLPPNSNTNLLTLNNVQTNQAGNYTVIISNSVGSVTSTVAVLTVLADRDGDGIPDSWEITYGLNPTNAVDAAADPDGDGMSNLDEYRADTDPLNPLSYLALSSILLSGSNVVLQFGSRPGLLYTMQYKNSLADNTWTTLTQITANGVSTSVLDPASGLPSRYYRLIAQRSANDPPVYSVNTLGFVKATVTPGTNSLTRPFLATVNNAVEFLIPTAPDGTCVFKWNPPTQSYLVTCYMDGLGWDPPNIQLQPGEAFYLNDSGPAFTLTFLGEVIPATPPAIITQPQNQTVVAGSNATFSIFAQGTPPLNYQWYKDGIEIFAATNPVYTINAVGAANVGDYFVTVANTLSSVTSIVATLTVRFPPSIVQQPQSRSIFVGSNTVFSVTASGDAPLGYQWYFANSPILAATNATLNLTSVLPGQSGDYYVVVSNAFGLATSAIATLTVSPCVAAPSGLIASWKGEGNAFDAVGDNHGTLANGATFAPGKVGAAIQFDGADDLVRIPNSASLRVSNVTVEAWVKANAPPGAYRYVLSKSYQAGIGSYALYSGANGGLVFYIASGGISIQTPAASPAIWDANFHHVAGTFDGQAVRLYVDGFLIGSNPFSQPINYGTNVLNGDLLIGHFDPGSAFSFGWPGIIDEISLYNRALSGSEVAAIYAAGSLGKCVPSSLPGAPVIFVNGQPALNIVTRVNTATIEMETSVPNGGIYFTLDGSEPGNLTGALRYTGPFILTQSATIRALAYSADLTSAADVHLVVVIPHTPAIVTQPQNQTVSAGSTVQFGVSVTGDAPLAYQWRKGGVAILGATGSSLVISNVQPANAGGYSVSVTNLYGGTTSVVATLTVIQPPHVTTDPVDVFTGENQSAQFCVSATGDGPLRYQWRKNGVNIPGATNRCYTNVSVRIADGGLYSVAIENGIDAVESIPARLTISMPISFGGDAFADRVIITESCFSGSNVGATSEAGEPRHANKPGGKSIWYKWRPPTNGIATFETTGSSFDTLLAVYTGTNVTGLTLVAADEDRGGFLNSVVRFNAVTNREYEIVVDGYAGAEGTYALCWRVAAAPVPLPVIVQQPHSFTVLSNQPYTLSVVATSTAPRITYQWFFNGRSLTNETNASLVIPAVRPQQVGSYWAGVSNSGVGLLSDIAVLEIGPFANIQSVAKLPDLFVFETNAGFSGALRLRGLAAAADASSLGISVGAGSINSQIINNTGTAGGSNPAPCRVLGGTPRFLLFLATNNATMRVDTFGSPMDTVLGMLLGTSPSTAVPMLCNDDAVPGVTNSQLQFSITTGNGYYIQADGKNAAEGSIFINWAVGIAPTNSQAPQNYTVLQGDTVILTNLANGAPTPSFQWRHDNITIPQATNQLLALTNIQPADGGAYSVVTSNTMGRITNTIAIITVQSNAFLVAGDTFGPTHLAWASSNATSFFPVSGGNPGGYLSNRVTQGAWRLLAPPDYSSNKFHCYDGLLSFDLRLLSGVQTSGAELSLEGRDLRLAVELPSNPITTSWTTYHVLLNETASGWRWHTRTNFGTPVTREQFLFVLTTLTNVAVLGQFDLNGGSLGIDNVFLLAPTSRVLSVRRDNTEWIIEWPWAIGYYDVESVTNLSEDGWAPVSGTVTRVGSLNSIRRAPVTQQFFRLRQRP
jgi:hypothetical protein